MTTVFILPPLGSRTGPRISRIVGGGVAVIVGVSVLFTLHLVVIAGIITIVRRDAQLGSKVLKRYNALFLLPVIERDDVVVIGGDDDGSMRTAPLGVLSGAVVVSVTGSSPR